MISPSVFVNWQLGNLFFFLYRKREFGVSSSSMMPFQRNRSWALSQDKRIFKLLLLPEFIFFQPVWEMLVSVFNITTTSILFCNMLMFSNVHMYECMSHVCLFLNRQKAQRGHWETISDPAVRSSWLLSDPLSSLLLFSFKLRSQILTLNYFLVSEHNHL